MEGSNLRPGEKPIEPFTHAAVFRPLSSDLCLSGLKPDEEGTGDLRNAEWKDKKVRIRFPIPLRSSIETKEDKRACVSGGDAISLT
jgi:hypothetical protein